MAKAKWTGDLLWNALNLNWEAFHKQHPEILRNTYKGKRAYWKAKVMSGETPMPEEPKLVKSWEVSAFNRETNEWETTLNHAYEHTTEAEDPSLTADRLFPQVEASRITPTRRKRAKRMGEMILGYGDGQVDFRLIRDPRTMETEVMPLHNIEQHRIILQMNAHYQPETTVNGGDFADFAASSRFDKDSDHFDGSMTFSMQWIHDFYSQMRADNPNAKIVEVDSNHAIRPKNKILKVAPEFYNFLRPGETHPAWTYYSMARLDVPGVEFISGYPNAEYIHGDPEYTQILWKHGEKTGNTAVFWEADRNQNINLVRFHNHGERWTKRTTEDGEQLFYIILGSSCQNNGPVAGYHSSVDDFNRPTKYRNREHVNSFIMIRDFGKGRYEPVTIDVVDGKAYYDGIEWDGTKPYDWEYKYKYVKKEGGNEV